MLKSIQTFFYRVGLVLMAAGFVYPVVQGHAQQVRQHVPVNPVAVPPEYMKLFDAYRMWRPPSESVDATYANSVENWAIHAFNEFGRTTLTAVRNWLFTRGEERIRQLAMEHKLDLVQTFSKQFNLRGMHIVFAQPYTGDTNTLYRAWYECAAKLKLFPEHAGSDELIGERVIAWVNSWDDSTFVRMTSGGDCMSDFGALSAHYGVEKLSADDITAIGFLSRRFAANRLSSKFASAEFLRQLIHDIFDPDEN